MDYLEKDMQKSKLATKFIGRGCEGSSTEKYRIMWKDKANCGEYNFDDIVFISANGNRINRIKPDFDEIQLAINAGSIIIIASIFHRERSYNIGEREVAKYLGLKGYFEFSSGKWKRIGT